MIEYLYAAATLLPRRNGILSSRLIIAVEAALLNKIGTLDLCILLTSVLPVTNQFLFD